MSLENYEVPEFLKGKLQTSPKYRIRLCCLPTPIHPLKLKDIDSTIFVKRDDLTDILLSGNKVRKLEFLLADAVSKKADCIITIGALQSNHCRAVAVAGKLVGLPVHLILRSDSKDLPTDGNVFIDRLMDASIKLVPSKEYYSKGSNGLLDELAVELRKAGKHPYVIPVGGSNEIGCFGYIECFSEIINSGIEFDEIFLPIGSGGSAAGIAIALSFYSLHKSSITKLNCICTCDNKQIFHKEINSIFDKLNLCLRSEEICNIVDDYVDSGKEHLAEELTLIKDIAQQTGMIFDPIYGIKAVRGFLSMIHANPERFKGKKILVIQTGGFFGLDAFHKQMQELKLIA